jgi:hypothetical protein
MVRFRIGPTVVLIELVRLMPRRPPWPSPGSVGLEGIAGNACATLKVAGTASAVGAESNASALVGELPTRLGLDRPMPIATARDATRRCSW